MVVSVIFLVAGRRALPHLLNKANQSVRRPDVYHSSSEKDPCRGDESAASKTDAGRETVAATSGRVFPLHYIWNGFMKGSDPGPLHNVRHIP